MSEQPKPRILIVDDEPNILAGFRRNLGRTYDVTTAGGGPEALKIIAASEPFVVTVTDMRMPDMDGVDFLQAARKAHKDTVYMMLTGNADQDTAVRAINQGQIFRFLNKPCAPELFEEALKAAIRQHELIMAERVLLRGTLAGCVRLMLEAISLRDQRLARVLRSVHHNVQALCVQLGLESDWRFPLAGSLCLVGCVVMTDAERGLLLEDQNLRHCAQTGSRLLRHIPRLGEVADMIGRQREDGLLPETLDLKEAPQRELIGARLLRFAVDVEQIAARSGGRAGTLLFVRGATGLYDPRLTACIDKLRCGADDDPSRKPRTEGMVQSVRDTAALKPGMVLAQDLKGRDGLILLSQGEELSAVAVEWLRSYARADMMEDRLVVLMHKGENAAAA